MNRKRAFSLIELLVVIAIIAILAALLLPVTNRPKAMAKRAICLNNLKQINAGLRMYSDDSSDFMPKTPHTNNFPTMQNLVDFTGYKNVMKQNVGLSGPSSPADKLFACPVDTFYYDAVASGLVSHGFHEQPFTDYSSYGFNAGVRDELWGSTTPGLAGTRLSLVKNPVKTVLILELPAIFPWSWHTPKFPLTIQNSCFDDAKNVISFVDGHVSYIPIYFNTNRIPMGGSLYILPSAYYDPPAGYDYKWSGN
jgi:prepilin-type N-terminal cleavage/methylation domain-containing protein